VSAHLIKLAKFAGFAAVHLSSRAGDMPRTRCGALSGSNQERASVWLIRGAPWRIRSVGESPALFSVGPLEQEIQKKVASKDAKRQK